MSLRLPKRILMTADTVGGVWTYAMELCGALRVYGIEVALATMGPPLNGSHAQEAAELSNVEVFESTYKLEWMDAPWSDVAAAADWLLGLEKRIAPDLVHLNGYAHGSLPWGVPRIVVGHSCVLSWWQAVKGMPAGKEWYTYREAVRAGLQSADLVVAPSGAMLASLREHYGPLENVAVIPNGRHAPERETEGKENIVFSAGRLWDDAKNISALGSVAPLLSWPVYIAGDRIGPIDSGGVARGERGNAGCGTCGMAHFIGRLAPPDLQDWLCRAAIYAFPAKYEPFGLSVLEAALAGCALVLGDIPSLREIWADAALYASPEDKKSLRMAIELLIENPQLRARLAQRAQARAAAYSVERMAGNYLKAYAALMRRNRKVKIELEAACAS